MAALALASVAAGLAVVVRMPLAVLGTAPTPGIITTFAGGGLGQGPATTIGQNAEGLAIFGTTLFIADQTHTLVRATNLSTSNETIVAGNGVAGSTGDGGQATAAEIQFPQSLAVNSSGDLYIATATTYKSDPTNLIRRVDHSTGIITTVAGGGSTFADNVAATATSISEVQGMTFDLSGNLLIADFFNDRVRRIDHTTGVITTVAGTGNNVYQGDGIPATSANITFPASVAVDSNNNILITSNDARLLKVDHSTGLISTVAGNGQNYTASGCGNGLPATGPIPGGAGLTLDGSGNPMFVGYNCVTKIASGNFVTVAGNGSIGNSGDGGPATSAFVGVPVNAVSDAAGDVFVSQRDNDVVRRVDHSTQIITTFAGTGQECGHSGDGGQAAAATMCSPNAVALDSAGDLFLADSTFQIVRKIDTGGVITTVAGNGTRGFGGDGGPATSAQLNGPAGFAVDAAGDLFISDSFNHRVRKVDPGGTITTYVGNGTVGTGGDGGPAANAQLVSPGGLVIDGTGNLFIADGSIREVTPGGTITTRWSNTNSQYTANSLAIDASGNLYGASLAGAFELSGGNTFTSLTTTMSDGVAIGPQGQVVIIRHSTNQVFLLGSTGLVPLAGINYPGFSGDGGPATSAWLNFPTGLAIDPTGDIFIADTGNQRVRRVQAYVAPSAPLSVHASLTGSQAVVGWSAPAASGGLPIVEYDITRHTGSVASTTTLPGSPPPTTTTLSGLSYHTTYTFTVIASNGWATSADSAPSAPITPTIADGSITTYAGSAAVGAANAIGQAPVSLALELPQIFIGDGGNAVVRTLDVNAGQETILAGNDSYGYSGDGGDALSAAMAGAGAVAECGPAGPIYIADTANFRIRVVTAGTISTFAGTGVRGYSGDGGPATQAEIGTVYGLACTSPLGGLLIADTGNGVIREVDSSGNISTLWIGLYAPTGIFAVNSDVTYVADTYTNRVWYLSLLNGPCVAAGVPPVGFACNGGTAEQYSLNVPRGISYDGTNLYIAEEGNSLIRKVDAAGNTSNLVGTGIAGFSGDGGPAASAQLNHPTDVAYWGNTNTLYIADFLNFRVRQVDLAGGGIRTIAGNGAPSLAGDGGVATSAQLGLPYAVAADPAGNEYIVDNQDNAIRKIDTNGVITTVAGSPYKPAGGQGNGGPATAAQLNDPRGIALDSFGNIYISDTGNNVVRIVDHSSGVITTVAGSGYAGFGGDGGAATSISVKLNAPRGLAVDASGNLYIADTGNNRIRRVDHSTGLITTYAGNGTAGFAGDGAPAASAKLSGPRGLAINAAGDLFIGDSDNNRIRKIDHLTLNISTLAGTGIPGAGGDGGPAIAAQLHFPFGLGFDAAGNLYVADTDNHRIRMVDVNGKISTVVGGCGTVAGYSGDGGPAVTAQLNFPYGVAVDGLGNVVIADYANNRMRGGRGLPIVGRADTCSGPTGTPGSRPSNQSSGGTAGPHVPDVGPRHGLDTLQPKSSINPITIPVRPHQVAGKVSVNPPVSISNTSEKTPPRLGSARRHPNLPSGRAGVEAVGGRQPIGGVGWLAAIAAASVAILWARMRPRRRQSRRLKRN